MRTVGFLLMVSGWLLTMATVALLTFGPAQLAFLLTTVAMQVGGLGLIARSHIMRGGRTR